MPDDQNTGDTTEETKAPEASGSGDGGTQSTDNAPKEDQLPEWARKQITDANGEAANYRTRLREAEEALKKAKSPEEFEAAIADFQTKNSELEVAVTRERLARKFNLPDELAEVISGKDEGEMAAHAEKLAKYAPKQKQDPRNLKGGLDPEAGDEKPFDPVAASREARKRPY